MLRTACSLLSGLFDRMRYSSVYRTRAMYVTDQNDFYNAVVLGESDKTMTPRGLLGEIHRIETVLGRDRDREIRFGPRSMDIDIEFFNGQHISEPDLEIPHPRLTERAFVLVPMLEICKKSADCIDMEQYATALQELPDQGVEYFMSAADFLKTTEADNGTEYANR